MPGVVVPRGLVPPGTVDVLENGMLGIVDVLENGMPGTVLVLENGEPGTVIVLENGMPGAVLVLKKGMPRTVIVLENGMPGTVRVLGVGVICVSGVAGCARAADNPQRTDMTAKMRAASFVLFFNGPPRWLEYGASRKPRPWPPRQ